MIWTVELQWHRNQLQDKERAIQIFQLHCQLQIQPIHLPASLQSKHRSIHPNKPRTHQVIDQSWFVKQLYHIKITCKLQIFISICRINSHCRILYNFCIFYYIPCYTYQSVCPSNTKHNKSSILSKQDLTHLPMSTTNQ